MTITANTARISIELTAGVGDYYITLHFEASTNFDIAALVALTTGVEDWLANSLMPALSGDLEATAINAMALHATNAPSIQTPLVPPIVGGVASGPLPANAPMVVTHNSLLRGRSFRGRNFVPGIPEADVSSGGLVNGTRTTALLNAFADIADIENATSTTHVILSTVQNGVELTNGVTTPVNSYSSDSVIRNMRTRQIGVGG